MDASRIEITSLLLEIAMTSRLIYAQNQHQRPLTTEEIEECNILTLERVKKITDTAITELA